MPSIATPPENKNEHRILILKEKQKFDGITTAEYDNLAEAIACYEDGRLSLYNKKPDEVAFFWGGKLKRTWGPMTEMMWVGPPQWLQEEPSGRLFLEDVSIHFVFQIRISLTIAFSTI